MTALRRLGFEGPYSGGKHQFMVRGELVLTIQNPHHSGVGLGLLKMVLKQAGIGRAEWESS